MKRSSLNVVLLSVCLLSQLHSLVVSVIVRDYNKVRYKHFDTFEEFKHRFVTLDHNVAFAENVLVGVATQDCMGMLMSPAFLGAQRSAANAITVATIPQEEFPLDLDQCAEVILYKYNSTVLSPSERTTVLDHSELTNWVQQMIRIQLTFVNHFSFPVAVYWHSESEKEVGLKTAEIGIAQEITISSFLGHVFSAYRLPPGDAEPSELVDWMSAEQPEYLLSPANRLETCEVVPGAEARFVSASQLTCDNVQMRFAEFQYNVYYAKRLGLNYVQPQLVRAVTNSGFSLRQLPTATFKWLKDWYDENKVARHVVEHSVGPCMNQHVAESVMTHLPDVLKEKLSQEVAHILRDWYGKGELKLTSIYGVRKYTNGAVLRMHVDTVNTHVVSAIINVDQSVDEDWPLVILDHDDNEHSLNMRPGDMLLYESAKLLHGRPSVFKGQHYDNIFIHYSPVKGWNYDWL